MRDQLSPHTRISIDEMGVFSSIDTQHPDPLYWNMCAAWFARAYAKLAQAGVDIAGSSQLAGAPAIPEWCVCRCMIIITIMINNNNKIMEE